MAPLGPSLDALLSRVLYARSSLLVDCAEPSAARQPKAVSRTTLGALSVSGRSVTVRTNTAALSAARLPRWDHVSTSGTGSGMPAHQAPTLLILDRPVAKSSARAA